jgi:hypothetical protein
LPSPVDQLLDEFVELAARNTCVGIGPAGSACSCATFAAL